MTQVVDATGNAARRTAILDAAWQLVAERGYHQVRVQDIARACGTSTGTVHYYFPGKDDVLQEALRYSVDKAFNRHGSPLREIKNARKRLLALIEMQLPIGAQIRAEWSIWLQFWAETCLNTELRPAHNEFYARWMNTVVRIVTRGQKDGTFRKVDPQAFARHLCAATDGAAIQILTGVPGMTIDKMRNLLVSIIDTELAPLDANED